MAYPQMPFPQPHSLVKSQWPLYSSNLTAPQGHRIGIPLRSAYVQGKKKFRHLLVSQTTQNMKMKQKVTRKFQNPSVNRGTIQIASNSSQNWAQTQTILSNMTPRLQKIARRYLDTYTGLTNLQQRLIPRRSRNRT